MKLIKIFTTIIFCVFFISGCSSEKKTLSGKKKNNTDEFLVKKKNPLVLPPNFNDLPKPETPNIKKNDQDTNLDFSGVLKDSKSKKKENKKTNNNLEKSISKILNSN